MFKKILDLISGAADEASMVGTTAANNHSLQNKQADDGQTPAGQAAKGAAIAGFAKENLDDPMMQPVQGISFRDYAAMSVKLSSGVSPEAIYTAMKTNEAAVAEASTIWMDRLTKDQTGQMAQLYGQYFADANNHPKLKDLSASLSAEGKANLDRIKTDRYFYEELAGAKAAATEHGLNGDQYITEAFGIPVGEFQAVFTQWLIHQNQNFNHEEASKYAQYQKDNKAKYAAKFAGRD